MMRRTARLATGLASLAVIVGVVAAVPYALIRFVGWPLPTVWPTLDQLRHVGQVGISETTVIKTLAVIVWVSWAQLTVAIAAETTAIIQRTTARTLPLLPGLQPLAARLVAGIALLASLSAGPRPALAIPLTSAVATAPTGELVDFAPTQSTRHDALPAAEQAASATTTIVTGSRDSWWTLAERHLDDGLRWREIRDLNSGRTVGDGTTITSDTDQLEPGWNLLVPADTQASSSSTDRQQTTTTVETGDHFWAIAEEQLTQARNRPPTDEETTEYWRTLVDVNNDRLLPPHDPDLIYPDQTFVLPPVPGQPAQEAPTPPAVSDLESADPPSRSEAGTTDQHTAGPTEHAEDWKSAIERAAPDHEAPSDEHVVFDGDDDPRTAFGIPADLAAGTAATALVAAGVLATLRWRRRRALSQRMPGLQLPTLLPETDNQISRLEAAAVPEPVLDDLAHLLGSVPSDAQPVLVTTGDDGTVVLLFDDTAPIPEPPEPWQPADPAGDGPVGWQARIGDRGTERSIGLPLLVTLGRTGPTTVHANLGAISRLTVTGHDDTVRRMLRTMTLQAATCRIAIPALCFVAGDDLLASLDEICHIDEPQQEIDAAQREIKEGIVEDDRAYRLIVCHDGVPPPDHDTPQAPNVGLLAASPSTNPSWVLHVDDRGTGRLELPDGGTVELDLPDIAPELLDDELTNVDLGATTVATRPEPATHETPPADDIADTDAHATSIVDAQRPETQQAWCEVQILGNVQVIRDGHRVEGITPKTLELLAYLATHRDGTTNELVEDAVWSGRAARSTQRIRSALAKLRDIVGDGPDGQPLIPRRTDGSQTLRLSDHVGCDLDRALGHLALAADLPAHLALEHQVAALGLVRGEPFRDMPVSWATDIAQRAIVQLQDAARNVAITCREIDDCETGLCAIEQALKLHDPCDTLYLHRAELERARGRAHRVQQIWDQLRQRHADDADEIAGQVSQPAPEIELAFQELMAAPS